MITNHGIKRIHHFVGHHSRNAQQQIPEKRSNHSVTQIFRQSFKSSSPDFLCRKFGSITPHNTGNLNTSLFQRTINCLKHHSDLFNQRSSSQTKENTDYIKTDHCRSSQKRKSIFDSFGDRINEQDQQNGHDSSFP